jgi:hypothetical protein
LKEKQEYPLWLYLLVAWLVELDSDGCQYGAQSKEAQAFERAKQEEGRNGARDPATHRQG